MGSLGLPSQAIRNQIASSVDLIIQVERHRDGGRRITQVTDVCGLENDVILLNDIFHFELHGEGPDGRLAGEYRISRMPPSFQERLVYFGVDRAWANAMAGAAG